MRTVIVDSQLLTNVQRCAQRVQLYFEKNLRTQEVAFSLQRGILVHQFLGHMYKLRKDSGNVLDLTSCGNGAYEYVKPSLSSLTLPEPDIKNVLRSLEQYVELYKFEAIKVYFVEEPFAIELYKNEEEDLRIVYVGVIDLIASIMDQPKKVFDHKSQARKSDFLLLDDQFEGYVTATGENQLTVNVVGLQTTVDPKEKMRRPVLSYTPFLLERWKGHVVYWIKQYLVYKDHNEWPENHQGCDKFNVCEFYQICTTSSDAARAWKIQSEFTDSNPPWDPTKVLENRT